MGSSRRRPHRKQAKTAESNRPQPFFVGEAITLTIDRLSYNGGRGVGRSQDFVVFCEGVAPNETVRARITNIKKSFAEAELVEVLTASPDRREPPCPVAKNCGGCTWQHIDYGAQIREKQGILEHSFRRLLRLQNFEWRPFLSAPQEFRYRNRVQIHKLADEVGFFGRKSNQIVNTDDCLIAESDIAQLFTQIRQDERYSATSDRPLRLEIAKTAENDIKIFAGKRPPTAALFSQVNTQQNERLIQLTLDSTRSLRVARILDLFCGAGNFTFPLAKQWPEAHVLAADLSQNSIERAQKQSQALKREAPIEFTAADVGHFLTDLAPQEPTLVLLDPPRAGCNNQTIEELLRLSPSYVVYISCNPMTLVRDLEKLVSRGPYKIHFVQGLDMFPQTEHIETFVFLSR